ncbi:MAG TPA: hypothetical protein DCG51_13415 [Erysipelotrichaceae bacterium]|nr:hypothetical protein [Erysipelotrichaceae bacterium]
MHAPSSPIRHSSVPSIHQIKICAEAKPNSRCVIVSGTNIRINDSTSMIISVLLQEGISSFLR